MQPIEGTARTFNSGGDFGMEKLSKVNELFVSYHLFWKFNVIIA